MIEGKRKSSNDPHEEKGGGAVQNLINIKIVPKREPDMDGNKRKKFMKPDLELT